MRRTALTPDGADGWSLNVPFLSSGEQLVDTMNGMRHLTESVTLTGREAHRAAAQILPHLNAMAVSARTVQDAVHVLVESGGQPKDRSRLHERSSLADNSAANPRAVASKPGTTSTLFAAWTEVTSQLSNPREELSEPVATHFLSVRRKLQDPGRKDSSHYYMLSVTSKEQAQLYVNGYGFDEYLECLRQGHPEFYELLSHERCRNAEWRMATKQMPSWEFEDETMGGRGLAYNAAQKSVDNRKVGMMTLLRCFLTSLEASGQEFKILDVLGGDGTVARFCKSMGGRTPTIYTADISKLMIDACHAQALPCLRQSATRSLFRDDVLDGVLIAYGSHHLDGSARRLAVREAHRTLKPGGRLVLHDFEVGGQCAQWFARVVHPYSRTGHPHAHFSRGEMIRLFTGAGFADVKVFEISDPFTLHGSSPAEARYNAVMHMYAMYDLINVAGSPSDVIPCLERHIVDTLGPISIRKEEGRYVAHIPRQALVAVGTKGTLMSAGSHFAPRQP